MSSTTSESTLAGDAPTIITAGHVTHSVASEDLSSMVFQAAELQGFASTWSSYMPVTINEHVMADSLRNCEDIANSLRDTLESLEIIPVSPALARDSEDVLHNSPKYNDNADGNGSSAYQLKVAETLKFLVQIGIEKIIDKQFSRLAKFEATLKDVTYHRWFHSQGTLRVQIQKVIEEDPEPLADFEEKVERHIQRVMMERAMSEFKRGLEDQWKKHGNAVINTLADTSIRRHPSTNSPPRKRVKIARIDLDRDHTPLNSSSHFLNLQVQQQSTLLRTNDNTIMTSPPPIANTYIPHNSLEPISLKIKRLQSDLSRAATGQCWGPDKQKVLDCKHDVDALATMVKKLDVDVVARKKSLDVLMKANLKGMYDTCVEKAMTMVDNATMLLIQDTLQSISAREIIKETIQKGLAKEPDVLLDLEAKFERYFKEALAGAVADLVAQRSRLNVLKQLRKA
ncbi:hypothetical protein KCU62_g7737, partial [Aureobasidium sp. EXF-3399]